MNRASSRKTISIIIGVIIAIAVIAGALMLLIPKWVNSSIYSVKICTSMNLDMQCEQYGVKEIVRGTEDDPQLCEQYGEAIYEVVGGFAGRQYVGCAP